MSNGDDQQSFPPPPNTPPEDPSPRDDSEESAPAAEDDRTNPTPPSDGSDPAVTGADDDAGRAEASASAEPETPRAPDSADSTESTASVPSPDEQGSDSASYDQETVAMPAPTTADEQSGAAASDAAPPAPVFGEQNQQSAPQHGAPNQGGSQGGGYPAPGGQSSPYQPQSPQQAGPHGQGLPPQNPNQQGFGQQGQPGQQNQPGQGGPYGQPQYPAAPGPNYSQAPYGSAPGANQPPQNPNPVPPQQQPYYGGPGGPGSGPQSAPTGSGPTGSQGIPQPAPAPGFAGAVAATRADARPAKSKKKRLPLFIALGAVVLVLVLVAVGFFVIRTVNKNNYGPDKVAQDYVAALNKGDFAAAEKIAPSPRPEGTNVDLLAKGFTDGSSGKIENAKVESSKVDGDKGTVTVSYDLDGNPYNVELPAKKDGRQDLFFDKWALTGPALHVISLAVPAADGMTVNGKEYTAQPGTTAFAVYPGNYDFKLPASKWVSEAKDTAEVNFPQAFAPGEKPNTDQVTPITLNLAVSPTPAFNTEVQKQVEKKLKDCFDNKSIAPKCKFLKFDPREIPVSGSSKKLEDLAKKDSAKWTIKEMPKVTASFGAGDPGTGSFFTDKSGKFNFSVQGKRAGSSYFSNDNPLSVSGSVTIDGDKLKVEFFDF